MSSSSSTGPKDAARHMNSEILAQGGGVGEQEPMERIDLNIERGYCENWSGCNGLRELLQNWWDAVRVAADGGMEKVSVQCCLRSMENAGRIYSAFNEAGVERLTQLIHLTKSRSSG